MPGEPPDATEETLEARLDCEEIAELAGRTRRRILATGWRPAAVGGSA